MERRFIREGVTAGIVGALTIALWFAIVDVVRGELLGTPRLLGDALASLFLRDGSVPGEAAAVLLYTLFHFGAFMIVGLIAAWVINASERTPSAFIGFAMLFVAFELGWLGWTTVLAQGTYGALSWLQVFVANLIAAAAMGLYLWRQHRSLWRRVGSALAGAPE